MKHHELRMISILLDATWYVFTYILTYADVEYFKPTSSCGEAPYSVLCGEKSHLSRLWKGAMQTASPA